MAITAAHKDHGVDITASSPFSTNSIAFANNKLYLVAVYGAFDDLAVTGITGGSLTWVNIPGGTTAEFSPSPQGISLWRGLVTSGAGTGALSISVSPASSEMFWTVDEFTGIDTGGSNGSAAIVQSTVGFSDSATSFSNTLSAFGSSSNAAYGYSGHQNGNATTPDTSNGGYTELCDFASPGTDARLMSQWNIGSDTSVTSSWSGAVPCISGAVEIKEAVTPFPVYIANHAVGTVRR